MSWKSQSEEWQQISKELINKWVANGSKEEDIPLAYVVTEEHKRRVAARGERYMDWSDVIQEFHNNGGHLL